MSDFPIILLGGLWHSTNRDRLELILSSGAILPEPDIPNKSRWCASSGPEHYPFVRSLGGVSLFDFMGYDHEMYAREYSSSVSAFVPFRPGMGNPVWIEINRSDCQKSIINGDDLLEKWNSEEAYGHNIMPLIEVAHIGEISTDKFLRVVEFSNGSWNEILLHT